MKDLKISREEFLLSAFKRLPKGMFDELKSKKVGIAGAGGLGSNIAATLIRSGIMNLTIADFDKVEASNLNRQYYFYSHIGMNKVDALKEQLLKINPFAEIKTYNIYLNKDNFDDIFSDCDIIAEAFDKAENKAEIVNHYAKGGIPIVSGNGMAGDYSANMIKSRKLGDNLYISGDLVSEANDDNGLLASRVAVVANHQAHIIIRVLRNKKEV